MFTLNIMGSNSARHIGAQYGIAAQRVAGHVMDPLRDRPAEMAVFETFARCLQDVSNPVVVDVGCGPGALFPALTAQGFTVLGCDISLQAAQVSRLVEQPPQVLVADAAKLPFRDVALHGIVARYALIHLPADQLLGVFHEFARVLLPGGLVLFSSYSATRATQWAHRVAPAYRLPVAEYLELIVSAGFGVVACEPVRASAVDPYPQVHIVATQPGRAAVGAQKPPPASA